MGVLKAMGEAGLRPDFIAGTSMGSVVGGLYAIGYSADEIEQILMAMDWDLVLSNQVPLNYISFEEKEYYNRYLVEFPIEGTSLKLPTGLIEGQVLGEFMRYYLWAAKEYESFDEFPMVFRCVGTNVSTGEPVLFEGGDLAMTFMFGGFSEELYSAYHEVFPLEPDWRVRVPLCNLYPTLVHVVLFGGGYVHELRLNMSYFV